MNARLILTVTAVAALLTACATAPGQAPAGAPAVASAIPSATGRSIDDLVATNGPPSRRWDLPDGRVAYQWQSSSIVARVGSSGNGEIQGAASQTTCFYTFYAKPDAKGVIRVVAAEEPRPGCMKLAMNGLEK